MGGSRLRLAAALAAAATLVGLLVASDYLPPGGDWYAGHPMTGAAISTVIGFVAIGVLLESWLKEREAQQLRRVSTVAYRSLAQYANDAGRALLAPLMGADLYALGVPHASANDARAGRDRLRRHGVSASFAETTGSWRDYSEEDLDAVLRELATDSDYVCQMFRTTALMRRRLQEGTAVWAPVMLTSPWSSNDLGRLRDLTDAFELLQEHWRLSGIVGHSLVEWAPDPDWLDGLSRQFWSTVRCYERIRDEFADLAELPSDQIVRRRG